MSDEKSPEEATLADLFRLMHGVRGELKGMRDEMKDLRDEMKDMRDEMKDMRVEMNELRSDVSRVKEELRDIRSRWESQTTGAMNVALHVLGDHRTRLVPLVEWARSHGVPLEKLP